METDKNRQHDEEEVGLIKDEAPKVPDRVLRADPETHLHNKKCADSILGCVGTSTQLSEDERRSFHLVKERLQVGFNLETPSHTQMLVRLAHQLFSDEEALTIADNGFDSDKWGKFGFQGENPSTDFRGSGLEGLRQLIVLSEDKPEMFDEMVELTGKELYMLACNSISITFYLKEYFHMGQHPHINRKEGNLASRKAFKSFCAMYNHD